MRILLFLIILSNIPFQGMSQTSDDWQQYLTDSIYKSDDDNYVYLYNTKGGINQKSLRYSLKQGQYVISTIYGDTLVSTKTVIKPNLFQLVYEHYDNLIKLPVYVHNKIFKDYHFKESFYDTTINFSQLGIKYYGLHFNHFKKFSESQIAKAGKNIADGMRVVNQLYKVLEEFESKQ